MSYDAHQWIVLHTFSCHHVQRLIHSSCWTIRDLVRSCILVLYFQYHGQFSRAIDSNVDARLCVTNRVGVNSIISTPTPTPEVSTPTPTPTPANLQNINSNSNSGGFNSNSNSNSGKSPEYQLQLQLRRFQLQLQFQLRQIFRISNPTPIPTPEISTPIPIPTPEFQIQPQLHFKSNQSCSTKLPLPNYNVKHCMN